MHQFCCSLALSEAVLSLCRQPIDAWKKGARTKSRRGRGPLCSSRSTGWQPSRGRCGPHHASLMNGLDCEPLHCRSILRQPNILKIVRIVCWSEPEFCLTGGVGWMLFAAKPTSVIMFCCRCTYLSRLKTTKVQQEGSVWASLICIFQQVAQCLNTCTFSHNTIPRGTQIATTSTSRRDEQFAPPPAVELTWVALRCVAVLLPEDANETQHRVTFSAGALSVTLLKRRRFVIDSLVARVLF